MIEPILSPEWIDDALCAKVGFADEWFPGRGDSTAAAKAVCRVCPVVDKCLERVMDMHRRGQPQAGVWGATSEHERKELMVGADRICPDCRVVTGPPVRGRNPRCEDCWKERRAETYDRYNQRRRGAA